MRIRRFRWGVWLAVPLIAGACDDNTGPRSARLDLVLTVPNGDDRAVAVTLSGAAAAVRAAGGFRVFVHDGEGETGLIVIPDGTAPFPTGDVVVATLEIEDAGKADEYTASVVQVATAGHELRGAAGYSARVESPQP